MQRYIQSVNAEKDLVWRRYEAAWAVYITLVEPSDDAMVLWGGIPPTVRLMFNLEKRDHG